MDRNIQVITNDPDNIVSVRTNTNSTNTVYYGDRDKNILEINVTNFGIVTGLDLIYLDQAVEGKAPYHRSPVATRTVACFVEDEEDLPERDFTFYLDQDELTILFADSKPTTTYYQEDRFEIGLDDEDEMQYIKINDLTKEEYENIITKIKEKNIPEAIEPPKQEENDFFQQLEQQDNTSIIIAAETSRMAKGYNDRQTDFEFEVVYCPEDITPQTSQIETSTIRKTPLSQWINRLNNQEKSAYELLFSSKQYRNIDYIEKLRAYAQKILNPEKLIEQYKQDYQQIMTSLANNTEISITTLIDGIRDLGIINILQHEQQFPVDSIFRIFNQSENKKYVPLVKQILDHYDNGVTEVVVTPDLQALYQGEQERINAQEPITKVSTPNQEEINKLYQEGLTLSKKKEVNSKRI